MKKDVFDYVWTDKKRTFLGLPWSFTRYYLTESKFITRTGIFSVQEDELELYRVLDKKLVLTMGDRMVGCGTIVMNVRDVDTPVKEIKSVKKPREVMKLLDQYIDMNRDKYRTRGRDLYGGFDQHGVTDDVDDQ
ncbi:MAG: PH domain-containing protein [Ruminococcus sp.]|uniref:PH domain-containing protein n=1 Tax=Ruminococcus sp. TaxID=41978 RepID=UPI0025CB9615|nr:PH domain-containing protein [Ruminococcus sp.]MCR5539976.1 PH domain-containing protein [Ruminococcus sp.]